MRVALSSFAAAAATPEGGMQERAVEPSPHRRRRPGRGNAVRGDLCGGSGGPGECGARRQASRWRRQPKTGGMQGAPSRHLCGGGGGPSRGNEGRTVKLRGSIGGPQHGECGARQGGPNRASMGRAVKHCGSGGGPGRGDVGLAAGGGHGRLLVVVTPSLRRRRRPHQGECRARRQALRQQRRPPPWGMRDAPRRRRRPRKGKCGAR